MLGIRKRAAAVAFAPDDLSNLYAQWTADAGLSSGALWTDQYQGFALTQATGANQPTYTASDTDGMPSLSFDGVNDVMVGPAGFSLPGDPALTIFLVCKPTSIAAGAYSAPFGWGNGSGSLSCFAVLFNYVNGGQPSVQTGGGNGVSFNANLTTGWQQYMFKKTAGGLATTSSARRNGVDQSTLTNTSASTPNVGTGTINLGRFADASSYFYSGKIRELIIYNRALTSTEIGQVEAYLASKWAL
jgi:hypothetical protein